MYERLVARAADTKNPALYSDAAAYCKVIQAIRQRQGRAADFERYYQGLLDQHKRRWALTRDLRQAIQGSAKPHTSKA